MYREEGGFLQASSNKLVEHEYLLHIGQAQTKAWPQNVSF